MKPDNERWAVDLKPDGYVHVWPIEDDEFHDLTGTECHCRPRMERVGQGTVVVHSAFDGREYVEMAAEIFKGASPQDG